MKYAKPATALSGDLSARRLIRPGEAAAILGVTVSTIYRFVKDGRLPAPSRISHRVSGWPAEEILPTLTGLRRAEDSSGVDEITEPALSTDMRFLRDVVADLVVRISELDDELDDECGASIHRVNEVRGRLDEHIKSTQGCVVSLSADISEIAGRVERLTELLRGLSVGFDSLVQAVQHIADAQPEQPTTPAA